MPELSVELRMLAYSALICILLWLPYILARTQAWGLGGHSRLSRRSGTASRLGSAQHSRPCQLGGKPGALRGPGTASPRRRHQQRNDGLFTGSAATYFRDDARAAGIGAASLTRLTFGLFFFDYDLDGWTDLFCANGHIEPRVGDYQQATTYAQEATLFRGRADGRYEDVSPAAGLTEPGVGRGAAYGDYDGDGDLDLFVTNYGANRLFANDGACRFSEVSLTAGVSGGDAFSAGASWGDYDNDGDLDLYVTNYVEFLEGDDPARVSVQYGQNIPFTLNPSSYAPSANRLYRNEGSGTFAEIGVEAGVDNPDGRSMSAAWADMDLDGDLGPVRRQRHLRQRLLS